MQIPKRPTEPIQFTLKEHEDKEDAPSFTVKPLSDNAVNEYNNLVAAGKAGSAFLYAAKFSVKGWTNLTPEYSEVTGVEPLPTEWKYEIGAKAVEISALTEAQKN